MAIKRAVRHCVTITFIIVKKINFLFSNSFMCVCVFVYIQGTKNTKSSYIIIIIIICI